ncbi:hypothetical protein R5R35_012573 [Gryllus longicercus]|uniref:UDP-glucuronosyltransferase n=1 Tax=Gryllus longicercus TaxID=2509291 RepID=A0AAN9Z5F6_9ORTH
MNTINKSIIAAIFLLSYVSIINSANILVLFTLASRSVHIWHTPLLTALANKGHNLTVISPDAQKTPVPNLTDLQVDGMYEGLTDQYAWEDLTESSTFYWISETFAYFENACSLVLKSDRIKQLLDYPPDFKFDLVLIEPVGSECLLGILPKFGNPPIVSVSSFALPHWVLEITGTSANPSYVPYAYLPHNDKMKFPERMYNSIAYLYSYVLYNYNYLPNMDREARYFFGSDIPSVYNTLKDTSITLSNYHPTLDTPLATTPNLIPIAAIQVKEPKPLPADIQTFLDEATEGAIYFSFGTNVRSDKLSLATRKAILEAFAELPQRVLWKFESDLPDAPKNVKISKWLPQNDILAHPNIKVFITHSGLHSTHETITRGVPVIGVPFMVDQHTNIKKLVKLGCGIQLEYKNIRKDTFLRALREIIGNPSYRENMKQLSARFQDNLNSPLETAVFWTEYVIRHKGAPHLQTGAKNLNFIQFYLLDIIAFLIITPTVLFSMIKSIFFRKKSKLKRKHN